MIVYDRRSKFGFKRKKVEVSVSQPHSIEGSPLVYEELNREAPTNQSL